MKRYKLLLVSGIWVLVLASLAMAQQPAKVKRPVKNPPQFPNIIDLENKEAPPAQQSAPAAQESAPAPQAEPFVQVLGALAVEIRSLVQEMRSMNMRQQAQLDMLRMTRVDLRLDHYEQELRPVREKLAGLENDEQNLLQLMTRDSLMAQTANMGTVNRDQTMEQIRRNYEVKLRAVQAEKERLRKIEGNLVSSMSVYQNVGAETERRIQATEESLRRMENGRGDNRP
ncbi:MAG TPA: hypothetical protein VJ302_37000 [Blastocatellia bacterium]|nr:hypothetical protein [Blastocatellia bacterium]